MATALPTVETFELFANRAVEGLSLVADANQKVLRQLVDLTTTTAAEGVGVYAALQSSTLGAVKSGQSFVLAQATRFQSLPKDPVVSYQRAVLDGVEGAQTAFKLIETSAETVTRSAERLQASADRATKDIQGTWVALGASLKALYTPEQA
ncbi:MAG: hypothetical protein FJW23_09550 [Acidimicrobiia bacterium]|nr:hypothetical protein [Acidimicrobiia bacterium]